MRTIEEPEPVATPTATPSTSPPASATPPATRPRIATPGPDRPISRFAAEVGGILGGTGEWFVRNDRAVLLREMPVADALPGTCRGATTTVFHYPTASECRSLVERWMQTGQIQRADGIELFVVQSMGKDTTTALLDSPQFKECLPPIRRILDVPVPVDVDGQLTLVSSGYDARLQTFCRRDVEHIQPLPLEEAKAVLDELTEGFPFANPLSRCLALARLLTPMCRGLMGWNVRTPLWVFEANRPRAGKDYLAGCCGILYEGRANEDAPLDRDSAETKKRITAALQSGRRFMHFANTAGDIRNDAFEQAVTAKTISARLLGSNDAASDLTLENELEFSVSGNTGFTFSEDFALRCRRISLEYFEEDANSRSFAKPDLHGWIRQNRARILGALAGLIWEWDRQGRPSGPTPFTSFPEWARIVGGILVACGLGDPCQPQFDGTFTRDTITQDMTELFRLALSVRGQEWLGKAEVRSLITQQAGHNHHHDMDLFPQWDMADRKGQTAFGLALHRYKGRTLGGIRMEADESDKKRVRYRFVPVRSPNTPREEPSRGPEMSTLDTLSTPSSGEEGGRVCGAQAGVPPSDRETGAQGARGGHWGEVAPQPGARARSLMQESLYYRPGEPEPDRVAGPPRPPAVDPVGSSGGQVPDRLIVPTTKNPGLN